MGNVNVAVSIEEWRKSKPDNPMHAVAAMSVGLAMQIGDVMNQQKDELQRKADRIEAINQLCDELRSKMPKETALETTVNFGPDKDRIIAEVLLYCPELTEMMDKARNGTLKRGDLENTVTSLGGATNNLTSDSQAAQAESSTYNNRYVGAMEQASNAVRKQDQLGQNIASGMRG
ncbi:hypothetical protein [Variovorax sp. KK3]|uniref:hypothetical protein n=1 Tax=Variovorax sp. KK3 TaxID=1855728 RepID=UPI00117C755C|nr:hypothetical protein [Variovorax sp. KK3]